MAKRATLTVQQWGNSLAVRIPAAVARSPRFVVGPPVEPSVGSEGVLVKRAGRPKLTLAQKLAVFDPAQDGGAASATYRICPAGPCWLSVRRGVRVAVT